MKANWVIGIAMALFIVFLGLYFYKEKSSERKQDHRIEFLKMADLLQTCQIDSLKIADLFKDCQIETLKTRIRQMDSLMKVEEF